VFGVVVAVPKNALRAFSNESSAIRFSNFISIAYKPPVRCNGFTKGTGAMFSIDLKHDHKDALDNRLYNCEQLATFVLHRYAQLHPPSRESEAGKD
jgi:hypothetical protein